MRSKASRLTISVFRSPRGAMAKVDAEVLIRIWLHPIKRIGHWKRQGDMRERVDSRRI